jgi:cytochrome c2
MDSFEWNKIAGAVLFALLVSLGLSIFSGIVFETEAPETPGYAIAVAESPDHEGGAAAPVETPIAVLLASADPAAGETSAKKCATCHTFGQGEANKVGPNLYDVVMRPIASHEGYEYSASMQAYAEEAKVWDYEHLNAFLVNPGREVPKTKMAFPGLRDEERANVIAFLRTLSAEPEPLPPPPTDTASLEPMAPSGDGAAPAEPSADTLAAAPETATDAPGESTTAAAENADAASSEGQRAAAGEHASAAAERAAAEPAVEPDAAEQAATAEPAAETSAEQQVAQGEAPAPAVPQSEGATEPAAAAGDVAKGQTVFKRCAVCHTVEEGGANKVGPNLWAVVGRPIATVPDFNYSDAMKEFSEGGAKTWTLDLLHAYLADPKGAIPGNKMAFPGLKNETQMADLLAYLSSLGANPQ